MYSVRRFCFLEAGGIKLNIKIAEDFEYILKTLMLQNAILKGEMLRRVGRGKVAVRNAPLTPSIFITHQVSAGCLQYIIAFLCKSNQELKVNPQDNSTNKKNR